MAELKKFLEIPYEKLEDMNFKVKEDSEKLSPKQLEKKYSRYCRSGINGSPWSLKNRQGKQ